MNCRAQIISLDALLALVIVMLCLGIIFNVMEMNAYDLKEKQVFEEISSVGKTASMLLASNPEIVCKIKDGAKELFSMNNCIVKTTNVSKQMLSIPNGFRCSIIGLSISTECNNSSASAKNVYSEKRKILVVNKALNKSEFEACLQGQCTGVVEEAVLKVWK